MLVCILSILLLFAVADAICVIRSISIQFISFHEDGTCFSFSNRFVEFIQWEKSFIWHTYTMKQLLASVHFNKTKQNKTNNKEKGEWKGGEEGKVKWKSVASQ